MWFVRAQQYNIYDTYHKFSVYGVYLYLYCWPSFSHTDTYKSTTISNKQYHRYCTYNSTFIAIYLWSYYIIMLQCYFRTRRTHTAHNRVVIRSIRKLYCRQNSDFDNIMLCTGNLRPGVYQSTTDKIYSALRIIRHDALREVFVCVILCRTIRTERVMLKWK